MCNYSLAKCRILADHKSTLKNLAYLAVNCQTESCLLLLSLPPPPTQTQTQTHTHTHTLQALPDKDKQLPKRVNLNCLPTKTFPPVQNNRYPVIGFSAEKSQSFQFERQPFKLAQLPSTSPSLPPSLSPQHAFKIKRLWPKIIHY